MKNSDNWKKVSRPQHLHAYPAISDPSPALSETTLPIADSVPAPQLDIDSSRAMQPSLWSGISAIHVRLHSYARVGLPVIYVDLSRDLGTAHHSGGSMYLVETPTWHVGSQDSLDLAADRLVRTPLYLMDIFVVSHSLRRLTGNRSHRSSTLPVYKHYLLQQRTAVLVTHQSYPSNCLTSSPVLRALLPTHPSLALCHLDPIPLGSAFLVTLSHLFLPTYSVSTNTLPASSLYHHFISLSHFVSLPHFSVSYPSDVFWVLSELFGRRWTCMILTKGLSPKKDIFGQKSGSQACFQTKKGPLIWTFSLFPVWDIYQSIPGSSLTPHDDSALHLLGCTPACPHPHISPHPHPHIHMIHIRGSCDLGVCQSPYGDWRSAVQAPAHKKDTGVVRGSACDVTCMGGADVWVCRCVGMQISADWTSPGVTWSHHTSSLSHVFIFYSPSNFQTSSHIGQGTITGYLQLSPRIH